MLMKDLKNMFWRQPNESFQFVAVSLKGVQYFVCLSGTVLSGSLTGSHVKDSSIARSEVAVADGGGY